MADEIENIRYSGDKKIAFDYKGGTFFIREPPDVLLVDWPGAKAWIWRYFGFLLQVFD